MSRKIGKKEVNEFLEKHRKANEWIESFNPKRTKNNYSRCMMRYYEYHNTTPKEVLGIRRKDKRESTQY